MTDDQKKLVEDNLGLCYHFAFKCYQKYDHHYRYGMELDDYISICYLEMCKAAMKWNSDIASFATYYAACATNAVRMFMREHRTMRHKALLLAESYDAFLPNGKTGRETYLDLLPDKEPGPLKQLLEEEMGRTAMRTLERVCDPKEKTAMTMVYFGGKSQKEVGDFYGCSQGYMCRVLKKARKKLRDSMAEVGYV